jgi:hypothetical protein
MVFGRAPCLAWQQQGTTGFGSPAPPSPLENPAKQVSRCAAQHPPFSNSRASHVSSYSCMLPGPQLHFDVAKQAPATPDTPVLNTTGKTAQPTTSEALNNQAGGLGRLPPSTPPAGPVGQEADSGASDIDYNVSVCSSDSAVAHSCTRFLKTCPSNGQSTKCKGKPSMPARTGAG